MLRLCCVALLVCCAVSVHAQPLKTWGYVAWWMPEGWRDQPLQNFERLVFFELAIDAQGNIPERNGWPERWSALRAAAGNTPIDVTVRCFDTTMFTAVFDTPAATNRLLSEIEYVAADQSVAGIQLDFEIYGVVSSQTLLAYRNFLLQLSERLHHMAPARQLTVFFSVGEAAALYDVNTLAQVDYVVVQGYDAHWQQGGESGPLSPLAGEDHETWSRSVQQALAAGVTRAQLVMSFPLYGYEWPVQSAQPRAKTMGEGRALYYAVGANTQDNSSVLARMKKYGYVYEPDSASSYYTYKRSGVWYAGWFEDGYALRQKADFLRAQKLRGVAFFSLGYDKGELVRRFLSDNPLH